MKNHEKDELGFLDAGAERPLSAQTSTVPAADGAGQRRQLDADRVDDAERRAGRGIERDEPSELTLVTTHAETWEGKSDLSRFKWSKEKRG